MITEKLLNISIDDLIRVETYFDGREMWPILTFENQKIGKLRIHGELLSELMPKFFHEIYRSL